MRDFFLNRSEANTRHCWRQLRSRDLIFSLRVRLFVTEYASTMKPKAAVVLLFFLVPCGAWGQDWRFYGADSGGTRFSFLQQINRENVNELKRSWTYHTGEVNRENQT